MVGLGGVAWGGVAWGGMGWGQVRCHHHHHHHPHHHHDRHFSAHCIYLARPVPSTWLDQLQPWDLLAGSDATGASSGSTTPTSLTPLPSPCAARAWTTMQRATRCGGPMRWTTAPILCGWSYHSCAISPWHSFGRSPPTLRIRTGRGGAAVGTRCRSGPDRWSGGRLGGGVASRGSGGCTLLARPQVPLLARPQWFCWLDRITWQATVL